MALKKFKKKKKKKKKKLENLKEERISMHEKKNTTLAI